MDTDLGALVEFSLATSWFQIVEDVNGLDTSHTADLLLNLQQGRQALRSIDDSFKVIE
jgi:hypothetical protein